MSDTRSEFSKKLFVAAGFISFGLGVIGAFLPVMPTVPFMILAALCFSKGSERWHKWMTGHPRYGAQIRDWEEHGVIRKKIKILTTCILILSLIINTFVVKLKMFWIISLAVVFALVLVFIWTRPSEPRNLDKNQNA